MRSRTILWFWSHRVSPVVTSFRPIIAAMSPARTSFTSSRLFEAFVQCDLNVHVVFPQSCKPFYRFQQHQSKHGWKLEYQTNGSCCDLKCQRWERFVVRVTLCFILVFIDALNCSVHQLEKEGNQPLHLEQLVHLCFWMHYHKFVSTISLLRVRVRRPCLISASGRLHLLQGTYPLALQRLPAAASTSSVRYSSAISCMSAGISSYVKVMPWSASFQLIAFILIRSTTPWKFSSRQCSVESEQELAPRRSLDLPDNAQEVCASTVHFVNENHTRNWYLSAWRQTVSDWGSTPDEPQNTTTAPSSTRRERSTSIVKSTCPGGVDDIDTVIWELRFHTTPERRLLAEVIVIPRSVLAPSSPWLLHHRELRRFCEKDRYRTEYVHLWLFYLASTWATIPMLRYCSIGVLRATVESSLIRDLGTIAIPRVEICLP